MVDRAIADAVPVERTEAGDAAWQPYWSSGAGHPGLARPACSRRARRDHQVPRARPPTATRHGRGPCPRQRRARHIAAGDHLPPAGAGRAVARLRARGRESARGFAWSLESAILARAVPPVLLVGVHNAPVAARSWPDLRTQEYLPGHNRRRAVGAHRQQALVRLGRACS